MRELRDEKHCFVSLAKQRLQNIPTARPSACDIVSILASVVLVPYRVWDCNKMEMIRDIVACEAEGRSLQWRELHREREDKEQQGVGRSTYPEHKPLWQDVSIPVTHGHLRHSPILMHRH